MREQATATLEFYYDKQDEATRDCLLALKSIFLSVDDKMVHFRKYQIPHFKYNELTIGYLWIDRKKIKCGFVEDRRSFPPSNLRMKDQYESMIIDPNVDIPVEVIRGKILALMTKYDGMK